MSMRGDVVLHLFSQDLSFWNPTDVLTAAEVGEEPELPACWCHAKEALPIALTREK